MKRNFKFCALGLLTILPLVGCNNTQNTSESKEQLNTQEVGTLSSLKKGFLVNGKLDLSINYYADSSYNIPSAYI